MKRALIFTLLTIVACLTLFPSPISAQAIDPQYIFVRKDPMGCSPADCTLLWNMDDPNKLTTTAVNDVFDKIGSRGNASNTRKIGIGTQFNYYLYDFSRLTESLNKLLTLSKDTMTPVYISLNGYIWWDKRPDLWNWWDSNAPGYNPDNKNNVEWNCDNPTCATKKALRNWGSEFEVKPPPNLASRIFIDDNKKQLRLLLPIILSWYNALPLDKQWLFGGIDFGTEVDIGQNYYGNGTIGYAAVRTLGLQGGPTAANQTEIIKRYLNELDQLAYDIGIPRNKIFNHVHPNFISSSVTTYGYPGATQWESPSQIDGAINQIQNTQWAAPEWYFKSNYAVELRNTLNYRNNKFLNISNWEQIRTNQNALTAIKTVINESPGCWLPAPPIKTIASGPIAVLFWDTANATSTYLNASNSKELLPAGTFRTVNIANANVTNSNNYVLTNVPTGNTYVSLIADGCTNQRKISYRTIQSTSSTFSPSALNNHPVKGSAATAYVIKNGKRNPIPNWDTYLSLGFTSADLIELPDAIVNSIPMETGTATTTPTPTTPVQATPTITNPAHPGDVTHDGHVNQSDFTAIKAGFGTLYSIFDYNNLVANFGK